MSEPTIEDLLSRIETLEACVASLNHERLELYIAAVTQNTLKSTIELEASSEAMVRLREYCEVFTPLHIAELRQQGGPSPSDFATAREFGQEFAEIGDLIMHAYGNEITPKERDRARKGRARLARAFAVMAFVPGGVKWLGMHWCEHAERGAYPLERERAERDAWYQATYDAVRADLDRRFAERPASMAHARRPDRQKIIP